MISVHARKQLVDELFTVAPITATLLTEAMSLADEASAWRRKLERPQEVGCLLEVRPDCVDFMDEVLDAGDAKLSQLLCDHVIVCDGDALLVQLAEAPFVNELPNCSK